MGSVFLDFSSHTFDQCYAILAKVIHFVFIEIKLLEAILHNMTCFNDSEFSDTGGNVFLQR